MSAAYGLAPEQGWVNILEEQSTDQPIIWINASVSGATTAAGLQRLPGLLDKHQPQWLLLELGANDGLQGKPIHYIKKNLVTLVEMAQAAGCKVALVGVRLPPNLGLRYTEPFFAMFKNVADQYGLPYLPFILEGVAGNDGLMQSDGLHPNANGQARVALHLGPFIFGFLQVRVTEEQAARPEAAIKL